MEDFSQLYPTDYTSCCMFFQAEDGIRDYKVTGVQTCALPIYVGVGVQLPGSGQGSVHFMFGGQFTGSTAPGSVGVGLAAWTGGNGVCGQAVDTRGWGDRKSGVEGNRVDVGWGRIV